MALSLSIVHGVVVNLFLHASAGLPGDDVDMWCMGWVFAKARICLRVTLSHLKLVPDVLEGDLGPPQPKSSHFGGLFKVLACFFPYRSLGEFQLRKCEKNCLLIGLPTFYCMSEDGEFCCAAH